MSSIPQRSARARRRRLAAAAVAVVLAAAAAVTAVVVLRDGDGDGGRTWRPLGEPGIGGRITSVAVSPADPEVVVAAGDVFGVARSGDGGATWAAGTGLASYEVADLTWHPSRAGEVWAGTMSGPYVSRDGGRTWLPRRSGMPPESATGYSAPVQVVVFDPADESRLLALAGNRRGWDADRAPFGTVWASTDGGARWARLGEVTPGGNVTAAAYAAGGDRLVATVSGAGVHASEDGGRTWVRSSDGLPHDAVLDLASDGERRLWVALGAADGGAVGGVYRSDDAGRTWRPSGTGLSARPDGDGRIRSQYRAVAVAPSDPSVVYTADAGWGVARVYRSDDGGDSWTPVLGNEVVDATPWGSGLHVSAIGVDPTDPSRAFVGDDERLLEIRGDTWVDTAAVASGDGYRGTGWNGLVAGAVAFAPDDDALVALAGWDGANPLVSGDGGRSWERPLASWDRAGGAYDVAWGPGGGGVALLGQSGTFNGVATTGDGGATWSVAVGGALPARGTGGSDPPAAVLAAGGRTYLATVLGGLYRSDDGGASWRRAAADADLGDLAADPADPGAFLVTSPQGLRRGRLDGGPLEVLDGSPGGPAGSTRVAVSPDGRVLLVAVWRADGAGLYRSDGGRWTRVLDDPAVYDAAFDPSDGSRVVVVTNDDPFHDRTDATGVLVSSDGGRRFEPANDGLPVRRLSAVAFDPHRPGRVVVGAAGGGFFEADLG